MSWEISCSDEFDPNVSLTAMLQPSPDPEGSKPCVKRSPLTSLQNSSPKSPKKPRMNANIIFIGPWVNILDNRIEFYRKF